MLESSSRRYLASGYTSTDVYSFDSNNPLNSDIRGDGASLLFGDGTIWKYVGSSSNSTTALLQGSYYTHWFVYRYADILLMKAEAEANLNNGADALNIINTIRTRANALPATALTPDPKRRQRRIRLYPGGTGPGIRLRRQTMVRPPAFCQTE